jgi:hypothetical protein
MTQKDGGPAYPFMYEDNGASIAHIGMSLRNYFAGQCMISRVAQFQPFDSNFENVAKESYRMADAMLAAREIAQPSSSLSSHDSGISK